MDLMQTAQLLGNFGEFFGAIAVVLTLGYLAVQVRQNTRSIDESRKIAIAATHQARAESRESSLRQLAESEHIVRIQQKLADSGFPSDPRGIESLTPEDLRRFSAWSLHLSVRLDNLYFQKQLGLIDDETYIYGPKLGIRVNAPVWKALGIYNQFRPDFRVEVDRVYEEGIETHLEVAI